MSNIKLNDKLRKYRDEAGTDIINASTLYGNKQAELGSSERSYWETQMLGFQQGFDVAILLDLPIKFIEWYEQIDMDELLKIMLPSKGHVATNKEIYQYWLENIYTPEIII